MHYRSTVKEPSKPDPKKKKRKREEGEEESFKASSFSSIRSFDLRQPPASISNIHQSDELLMDRALTEAGTRVNADKDNSSKQIEEKKTKKINVQSRSSSPRAIAALRKVIKHGKEIQT